MAVNSLEQIDKLYKDSVQLLDQARQFMAKDESGQFTDADKQACDKFIAEASEKQKLAKRFRVLYDADIAAQVEQRRIAEELESQKPCERLRKWNDPGEFIVAVYNARLNGGTRDARLVEMEERDLAGEVGISGGFLIPPDFQNTLLTVRDQQSFLRKRGATIVPMRSRTVLWPAVDVSQGAAGVNAFSGGIRMYWTEENNTITESQPRFKMITLHARELLGLTEVPNSTLRDSSTSLAAYFSGSRGFGGAIAAEEDYQAINGTGAGKPFGVLNSPAKIAVSRNAATNFKFVDAVTMLSRLLLGGSPVWLINQSVMPKLLQFADAANINIFVMNAALAPASTLLGLPIEWTGKQPVLGTAGDVILLDMSMILIGDRQQMTLDVDRSYKFATNQTGFRVVESIDIQPWLPSTITLMDGSTTVSAYIVLT